MDVWSETIAAAIGMILGGSYNWLKKKFGELSEKRRLKSLNGKLKYTDLRAENPSYVAFEHGIPYILGDDIVARDSGEKLFIDIPEEFKTELEELSFVQRSENVGHNQSITLDGKPLAKCLAELGVRNPELEIQEAQNTVATQMIRQINGGSPRFNGYLAGLYGVEVRRIGSKERTGLSLKFYQTDYYTYQVLSNIYQTALRGIVPDIEPKSISDLRQVRFLTASFGVACWIILDAGEGPEVLIGHRSDSVVVDKDKLHFSMNEALNSLDQLQSGNYDLSACVYRGLEEEIGIRSEFRRHLSEVRFLDFGVDLERLEAGISCFIEIRLDENFTLADLKEMVGISKDAAFETKGLYLQPLASLHDYLERHKKSMSAGARSGLEMLVSRYKAGYVPVTVSS